MEVINFGDAREFEVWLLCAVLLSHFEHTVQVRLVEDSKDAFRDPFEARAYHSERIYAF